MVFSSKLKKKYLDKNIYNDYIWRNLIFMSLIKCYECSKEISDKAKDCPHCGVGKAIECHECSKQISKGLKKCPHCGAPKFSILNSRTIKVILYTLLLILPILSYAFLFESNWEWDFHIYTGLICIILTILTSVGLYSINKNKMVIYKRKRKRKKTIIATIVIIIITFIGSVIYSSRPTVCNCIEQAEMNSSISDECIVILSNEGISFKNKNELERSNKKYNCE